jgi:hypothetical protein
MYFLAPRDLGRAIRFVAIHSVPKVDGLQAFAAPTEPLRHRLRDASAATGGLLLFIGLASSLALIRFRRTAVR